MQGNPAATQTRTSELAHIATLTAPTATPAPRLYTAQDVLRVWEAHGLGRDTLRPTNAPPTAGLTEQWYVLNGVTMISVGETRDTALAFANRPGGGILSYRHYVQANIVLSYSSQYEANMWPYALALRDLP